MISFRWYYKGQSYESNMRSQFYKISEYCFHFVLNCLRASILLLCTEKQRSREILKMFVIWSFLMFILCIESRLNEVQSKMNCANVKSRLWRLGGFSKYAWFGWTSASVVNSSGNILSLASVVPLHSVRICSIVSGGDGQEGCSYRQILQHGSPVFLSSALLL